MECLIRMTQTHEDFRVAEIQALANLNKVDLEILSYRSDSPFCIVKVPSENDAIKLVQRSILVKAIYEIWGKGNSYEILHENMHQNSSHLWPLYENASFRFSFDAFQATRPIAEQKRLINTFRFLKFEGPIKMKGADHEFSIFEEWKLQTERDNNQNDPSMIYFGRYLGGSDRNIVQKFDLKKRRYICTTSMDAELALITANITLASSGKLFYDPFVGSGSFSVACAHFGAMAFGSDIDGRSIRGKGNRNLVSNFIQYNLKDCFGDCFVADLTNCPLRCVKIFDGIICDPPYGVREGLKVLGSRDPFKGKEPVVRDGQAHHTLDSYIPPKRPYGFLDILEDILDFAALSLVENGRLSFWMPTSNDENQEIKIPQHPCLKMISVCTQNFSKWSRRLITYSRLPDSEVAHVARQRHVKMTGLNADELNPFRRGYFRGFKSTEI
ncbi:tRNA -methyltransferase [Golovinomyces cichoracearum]|uniref:tRNA (guanine(10)-N(2))-methyltransferase n=1 Tax=Golovinomyces cichoracearum TaxID=62708 RepID=A0A420I9D8_9PEZI|nr:tRNA -methyltransferase [Golovinomyces cichoracearum]